MLTDMVSNNIFRGEDRTKRTDRKKDENSAWNLNFRLLPKGVLFQAPSLGGYSLI